VGRWKILIPITAATMPETVQKPMMKTQIIVMGTPWNPLSFSSILSARNFLTAPFQFLSLGRRPAHPSFPAIVITLPDSASNSFPRR
jgi:hypothetical protein